MLLDKYLFHNSILATPQPLCLSYDNLLQHLHTQLLHNTPQCSHPLLLNTYQMYCLWKKILAEEGQTTHQGFIEEVAQAWAYCALWQINPQNPAFCTTPTTHRFSQWTLRFQDLLDNQQLIAPEQLVPYFMQHNIQSPSHTLIWLCFDGYTPHQLALQNHFAQQGCAIHQLDLPDIKNHTYALAAETQENELQSIIAWAKQQLLIKKKRIGVVVPDLNQRGNQIHRMLQKHFTEEQYNISLGHHLTDYNIVSHALCCMRLSTSRISNSQVRLLINSPFLAHSQTELHQRLQCLAGKNLIQDNYFSLHDFCHSIQQDVPLLSQVLSNITVYPKTASPAQWSDLFQTRLAMLGFPGEYPLDSANYQCYQRLLNIFDEFKKLMAITSQLNCSEALSSIHHLAQTTIFQPEKNASAPLQVLGMLEASGCEFDSLWIAGMIDNCLPKKTQFSPFIPIEIQKKHGLPYTDPDKEYFLAEQTLRRFMNAASEIVLSYPLHTDGQQNLPSPLLSIISAEPCKDIPLETSHNNVELQTYQDNYLFPYSSSTVTGSTSLLAHQAQCPFRAFAAHRLSLTAPPNNQDGLSLKERGILLHRALEIFWSNIPDQQQLCAMREGDLSKNIQDAIQRALQPYSKAHRASFLPLLQEIESDRLHQLMKNMILWEKNRPEFTIYALEKPYELTLAHIHFRIRVDRIDQLETGERWVIDYKSTLPSPLPWNEDIPTEPQMLLYGLIDTQVNTLLFAQLKKGQFISKGVSDTDYALTGIKTLKESSWQEKKHYWRQQLTQLADSYYQGYAAPQPKHLSMCKTCDFVDLCRTSFKN